MGLASESFDFVLLSFNFLSVFVLGLVLGSFSTAVAYRVPKGMPWALGAKGQKAARSSCTSCGTTLQARDLVPVFSWLLQKGRCRHCDAAIPVLYPASELMVVLLCLAFFAMNGFVLSVPVVIVFFAISFLVALSVIDFQFKILPNQLIAILAVLGLFYHSSSLLMSGMHGEYSAERAFEWGMEYGGGAFVFGGVSWVLGAFMKKILGKDALGMGDVKFFAVAGLWLGLSNLSLFCILSGMSGVLVAVLWKKVKGEDVFPFGPALILAFYIVLSLESSHFL